MKKSKKMTANDRWSGEMQAASASAIIRSPLQTPHTLRVILTAFIVITAAESTDGLIGLPTTAHDTLF